MAQDDYIRTALRVPPDLHKEIHEAADRAGRSFNAECIARLRSPLAADETESLITAFKNQTLVVQSLGAIVRTFASELPAKVGHGIPADAASIFSLIADMGEAYENRDIKRGRELERQLRDRKVQAPAVEGISNEPAAAPAPVGVTQMVGRVSRTRKPKP